MDNTWWSYFVILLGSLLALLYKYSTRNHDYWKKRNVYFIKPYPVFGSILPLFTLKIHISQWFSNLFDNIKDDYFGIFVFRQPVLIVKSPKLVKAILEKDSTYFEERSAVMNPHDPVMSQFMFFKKSPEYKPLRSKLSPNFTPGKIKLMFPLILHESNEMIDYLGRFANIPNIEAKEVAAKYTTNVIARCGFGVDAGSFRDENSEFRNITRAMFESRLNQVLRQFASFLTLDLVKLFNIEFFDSKITNSCKRIFFEVLNAKRQSGDVKGGDIIDMMLETNKKYDGQFFTDEVMVSQAIMFLIAGFESTSTTIGFTLYELAMQPGIQERLRNEILDITKKESGLTYSAIQDMKYLDMVVCESLRKYPFLPYIDRVCKADYKVEGTNLVIEKGTPVYIPQFALHYNPEYFPDPYKFDPERFTDKSKINNEGIYFSPFGQGPRNCLGERFGLLAVKMGILQIILKFRLEKSPQTPDRINFNPKSLFLQSDVGLPLTFVPL